MIDVIFTKPSEKDIFQLESIWSLVFCENPKAVSIIFDKYYDLFNAYCAKVNEQIIAAVYLVDCNLNNRKSHYLCGAATLPEYRGQGIMSTLIEYALSDACSKGDKYSLLFPAEESLYSYYEKLGYKPCCKIKSVSLSRKQLEDFKLKDCCDYNAYSDNLCFEQIQKQCFDNSFVLYNNRFISFAAEYYDVYDIKFLRGNSCFAFVEVNNNIANVLYFACTDFNQLKALLLHNFESDFFSFVTSANSHLGFDSNCEKGGMLKILDKNKNYETMDNIYLGVTLS